MYIAERNIQAELDEWLKDWHRFTSSYQYGSGYASVSAGFGQYRAANHWDSWNGADEEREHQREMEAMEACINAIAQPYNAALHLHAKNLCAGGRVWSSPRLPADPAELSVLVTEAKNKLARRMIDAGILN